MKLFSSSILGSYLMENAAKWFLSYGGLDVVIPDEILVNSAPPQGFDMLGSHNGLNIARRWDARYLRFRGVNSGKGSSPNITLLPVFSNELVRRRKIIDDLTLQWEDEQEAQESLSSKNGVSLLWIRSAISSTARIGGDWLDIWYIDCCCDEDEVQYRYSVFISLCSSSPPPFMC